MKAILSAMDCANGLIEFEVGEFLGGTQVKHYEVYAKDIISFIKLLDGPPGALKAELERLFLRLTTNIEYRELKALEQKLADERKQAGEAIERFDAIRYELELAINSIRGKAPRPSHSDNKNQFEITTDRQQEIIECFVAEIGFAPGECEHVISSGGRWYIRRKREA